MSTENPIEKGACLITGSSWRIVSISPMPVPQIAGIEVSGDDSTNPTRRWCTVSRLIPPPSPDMASTIVPFHPKEGGSNEQQCQFGRKPRLRPEAPCGPCGRLLASGHRAVPKEMMYTQGRSANELEVPSDPGFFEIQHSGRISRFGGEDHCHLKWFSDSIGADERT